MCSQLLYTEAFSIRSFGLNVFFAERVSIYMTLTKHKQKRLFHLSSEDVKLKINDEKGVSSDI